MPRSAKPAEKADAQAFKCLEKGSKAEKWFYEAVPRGQEESSQKVTWPEGLRLMPKGSNLKM
jgi:hypothetical protein